ncbi:probable transcription factor At1g11510 [Cornus florida]|uniref:probable transcription factor At1g11510 n=1 Tax=Cornus florida TaxID=4283 RepID=UPI0028993D89|nr:probable transcription factor At1g11510 [Cornus florida]
MGLTDMGAFYEYIKNSLHVVLFRKQLANKISRLKKKYRKNARNGMNPFFSNPHERKTFEHSKKIWGNGVYIAAASCGIKANGEIFLSMYPRLNESLQWVNHGLSESRRNFLKEEYGEDEDEDESVSDKAEEEEEDDDDDVDEKVGNSPLPIDKRSPAV